MNKPNTPTAANTAGREELIQRVKFLLLAILTYRIGAHIPVPGIDPAKLDNLFKQNQETILSLFNMFSGGALERMSVFALGIMPYISASIIMQLLSSILPQLEQLRKEGEAGRRKIAQYTRYGTLALATIQAFGMAVGLSSQGVALSAGWPFYMVAVVTLVTGTMFLMWLGEQITERGVGNGISMIIFSGIVAGLPGAIGRSLESAKQGEINLLTLLAIALLAIGVVWTVIFIERGQRRITVNYAKRMQGRKMVGGQQTHLPLKVNMAGVIPPIFASSILLFPASLGQWFGSRENFQWLQDVSIVLGPGQPLYVILFALGIVFFCYFYTALVFNPKDVADNLKKSGAFIPGIRPGEQSAKYIDSVLTRLTLVGAVYITAVCLLPQFLQMWSKVPFYLGGTSLLIVVVVVMDLWAQIQAHLMSHSYSSVLKKANLKN